MATLVFGGHAHWYRPNPRPVYGNYAQLTETGYFFECYTEVMSQATDLWQALADFIADNYREIVTPSLRARHQEMLDSLPQWYSEVDRQTKTLLYGDVNPQNLAFARDQDGFTLSVFDWERAVISLPQRDLAEYLIYTLPIQFSETQAMTAIDLYLQLFARHSSREQFLQGLTWMLYDLIINRLPLMMLVNTVAQKRRHSAEAYTKAHRLVSQLAS